MAAPDGQKATSQAKMLHAMSPPTLPPSITLYSWLISRRRRRLRPAFRPPCSPIGQRLATRPRPLQQRNLLLTSPLLVACTPVGGFALDIYHSNSLHERRGYSSRRLRDSLRAAFSSVEVTDPKHFQLNRIRLGRYPRFFSSDNILEYFYRLHLHNQ